MITLNDIKETVNTLEIESQKCKDIQANKKTIKWLLDSVTDISSIKPKPFLQGIPVVENEMFPDNVIKAGNKLIYILEKEIRIVELGNYKDIENDLAVYGNAFTEKIINKQGKIISENRIDPTKVFMNNNKNKHYGKDN